MRLYKFTAVLKPEREGKNTFYQVGVPALPEIVTFGESVEEAVFMAQDALELVVLSRLEEGEVIPKDKKPVKTRGAITGSHIRLRKGSRLVTEEEFLEKK